MLELILAVQVEIGFGATDYRLRGDGTWYQKEFEHTIDSRAESWSLGLKHKDWRLGYEYLGRVESDALATASDTDYQDGPPYWPLSHWHGRGETAGWYLSKQFDHGDWFTEIGVYAYVTSWKMTIPDWRACETCESQFIEVEHKNERQYNAIVGLGYRIGVGDIVLTVRPVENDGDQWPSIVKDWSPNISVRVSF